MSTIPQVISNIAGGLGLPLAGEDHITGLLIYDDPTDYPSGILKKWVTATAYLEDDVVEDNLTQILYTVQADYTSGADVATDVTAVDLVIIAGASNIRDARIKQVYKNTLTSFGFVEGGISDDLWYMLDKYFAKNPDGFLWVGIYSTALTTVTFAEVSDFQLRTAGKIRKLGIYNNGNDAVFAAAHMITLQALADAERVLNTPLYLTYCPLAYTEAHASFLDLRASGNNDLVTVFNSFDQVANSVAKPALGTYLGYFSISKVSESIGHIDQYNFVEGADLENTFILDSSGLVKYEDFSIAQLNVFDTKGMTFLYKKTGYSGTYLNANQTCVAVSHDFRRAEMSDTMDKASRNVRLFCIPLLNSEVIFNSDGTLRSDELSKFYNAAERALDPMLAATELSSFSVDIDATQKVQTTENLNITVDIVLNGVSKTITVNLTSVASTS